MDLSKPSSQAFNSKVDRRLEELQEEIKRLEREHGFSEQHVDLYIKNKEQEKKEPFKKSIPKPKPKPNLATTRYDQLPKIEVDKRTLPKPEPAPAIDPSWKSANKMKPSLETFYDKSVFMPNHVDEKDFQCKPSFCSDYGYFYNYMGSFGLNYTK